MKFQWPFRRDDDETETKALYFTPAAYATQFGMSGMLAPGSNLDYAHEVRDGMHSSVVTSALGWMMRTFPEAPLVVQRRDDKKWETQTGHALAKLLRRPNPDYDGNVLWASTIRDFCYGEAYWLKIRNGRGELVELYWVPRQQIDPIPSQTTGLKSHYDYRPGNGPLRRLELSDVVHFRFGADPNNILRGFSPLAAVMREVYIDDQAANFTAAILKNLGIIGVILSPKDGNIPKEAAEALKSYVQSNFTGDKRGQAMLFTGAMQATLLQYNLNSLDVGPLRDIVEERVSAALAIPAAVIGFGTGLQQTKVGATMREMVKLAWQGGIEPLQRIMSGELDRALLPEFQANPDLFRCWFDTSEVEALTESPTERTDRVLKLVEANVIKVSQAQRELGYPVDETQDKYARELTPDQKPVAGLDSSGADTATEPQTENGTGNKAAEEMAPENHVHLTMPEINVAPAPIHLTIEAPRGGTVKRGTMEKIDGKTVFTMTEDDGAIATEEPPTNGDGSHE